MSEDLFRVQDQGAKRFKVRRNKKQWVEGAFVAPDINDEQAVQYANTDGFLGKILSGKRINFFIFFALAVFAILLGRATQLQVVQGAYYKNLSEDNRLKIEPLRADRGLLFDRFQKPLVRNVPNYIVAITPQALPNNETERNDLLTDLYSRYFIHYIEESLQDFINNIEKLIDDPIKRDKEIQIASQLKQDHAVMLQIEARTIDGLNILNLARREYLNDGPPSKGADDTTIYPPVKSLSHILGYLTSLQDNEYDELRRQGYLYNDLIGRTGLEAFYEQDLRGKFGAKQKEVNALGNLKRTLNQQGAEDGLNITTTIDLEFQREVERILQYYLDEEEKSRGSVVVIHPSSGEVLSLVSLPAYDNNDFSLGIDADSYNQLLEDPNNPLFNRSISGEYPSGSTFKPIVAAAALEEQIVSPRTEFLSTGGIRISRWFFPDWRAGGHGSVNVYGALADSVNTYFYIIGGGQGDFVGLGVSRISDYARRFGLDRPLGIDIAGEAAGFLPSKEWKESVKGERWYIGDTYHLAIGQGDLLVTPLQMAMVVASIANGGTLYEPHFIKAYLNENLDVINEVEPKINNEQVVSASTINIIQDGLRGVVTSGSGRRLSTLPLNAAGKTGTAQWHSQRDPHAWFIGYAPIENPAIAFSILVEEGEEGSKIGISIARDILQWWEENRAN